MCAFMVLMCMLGGGWVFSVEGQYITQRDGGIADIPLYAAGLVLIVICAREYIRDRQTVRKKVPLSFAVIVLILMQVTGTVWLSGSVLPVVMLWWLSRH